MPIIATGIDLAKCVFAVHGVSQRGGGAAAPGSMHLVATTRTTRTARHALSPRLSAPRLGTRHPANQEPVGLGERRLRIDRNGPFLTVFLPHSWAIRLRIRQELSLLGPILAFRRPKPDRLLGCMLSHHKASPL